MLLHKVNAVMKALMCCVSEAGCQNDRDTLYWRKTFCRHNGHNRANGYK